MPQELITQDQNITTADLLQRGGKPEGTVSNTASLNHEALFPNTELDDFRRRWNDIQAGFVDEPKPSIEKADQLVASVIQRLAV
jgi:hypothetical protein